MVDTESSRQTEILTTDQGDAPKARKETTSIIFVSLYMLLLAFFIFLQSISVFKEERVRSVLGSVEVAFQGFSRDTPAEQQKKRAGEEQGMQAFHAKLKTVFETAVPLIEAETRDEGTRLQLSLPLSQLFGTGSTEPRESLESFFDDVAATLIARDRDLSTEMEILIETGVALPALSGADRDLATRRLTALLRLFTDKGVPARNLSIGIAPGEGRRIHFSFFPRKGLGYQFRPQGGAE